MSEFDKFEEYKLFVEDTARFSERRQTVSRNFATVNALLVTAITLLIKDSAVNNHGTLSHVLVIPLVIAGILVCIWWKQLVFKYKTLVRFRMDRLMSMEQLPEMRGCDQMYTEEGEDLYKRDEQGTRLPPGRLGFSDLEGSLPILFGVLYVLYASFLLLSIGFQIQCQFFSMLVNLMTTHN